MDHDTLSDVLRNVRLRGAVFFSVSGNSGWVAEAPPARQIAPLLLHGVDHVMEYHVVAAGTCWAAIPDGPSAQLCAGDVVMFPHGDAHVVSSAPGMRADPAVDSYFQQASAHRPFRFHYESAAPATLLDFDSQPPPPKAASVPVRRSNTRLCSAVRAETITRGSRPRSASSPK